MSQAILDSNNIAISEGNITVYLYSEHSGEYITSDVEYLASGVGIPANSCVDAPGDARHGFALCRCIESSSWEYVVDHRGEKAYDIETGQEITISAVGEYPENTTSIAPSSEFDVWNGSNWVTDLNAQHAVYIADANNKKSSLLSSANSIILPLQDAVDLGMATADESVVLTEWKKYRVLLMRVDTSVSPDITWPTQPSL